MSRHVNPCQGSFCSSASGGVEVAEEDSAGPAVCAPLLVDAAAFADDLPGLEFFFSCAAPLTLKAMQAIRRMKYVLVADIDGLRQKIRCSSEPHILNLLNLF